MSNKQPQINYKQQIKEQYKKCMMSPAYFLKNYAYIQNPNPKSSGRIKFDLYDYQESLLNDFQTHPWNIILKSRQLGISTLSAGYSLWRLLFKQHQSIVIIANKQAVAKNLIKKIRIMYQFLPSWMKMQLIQDNMLSLQFKNRSFIKAQSANPDAGVSEALSLLIIDQAGIVRQKLIRQIVSAALPTLSQTNGNLIALSSPRGIGSWFHQAYTKAQEGLNDFNPIKLPWDVHPNRDLTWRKAQDLALGEKRAAREYDCIFQSTGDSVISPTVLQDIIKPKLTQPIQKLANKQMWIFQYPIAQGQYIISADVARGDGSDYSAFHIIDVNKNQQVGQFKGKLQTTEYAQLLMRMGKMYNNALIIVQNANIGWAVLQKLIDQKYQNLHYHKKDYQYIDKQLYQLYNCKKNHKQKDVPGFTTSSKSRPVIIQKTIVSLQNEEFIIRSKRTFNQFQTFIWQGGKQQAMYGYNDDLVMSLCIGIWVINTSYFMKQHLKKIDRERLDSFKEINRRDVETQRIINLGKMNRDNPFIYQVNQNQSVNLYEFYGLNNKNK